MSSVRHSIPQTAVMPRHGPLEFCRSPHVSTRRQAWTRHLLDPDGVQEVYAAGFVDPGSAEFTTLANQLLGKQARMLRIRRQLPGALKTVLSCSAQTPPLFTLTLDLGGRQPNPYSR